MGEPIKTGDMIASRSNGKTGAFISTWTMARTCISGWGLPWVSHTACILERKGELWVYESTSLSSLKDGITGDNRVGVQAHKLTTWLMHYPGKVWHVPLAFPLPCPWKYAAYLQRRHDDQTTYDRSGAIRSASFLARFFHQPQRPVKDTDTGKPLYCTAYYLHALRRGGVHLPDDEKPTDHYPRSALALPCMGKPRELT